MKHLIAFTIIGILTSCMLSKNIATSDNQLSVAFYNVENLFDTIDDPHTNDNEFLPTSKKAWNTEKLRLKMQKLDSVIHFMTPTGAPDILGVCEVENKQVCIDWQNQGLLKNYTLVHRESPDHRGIDVALFYNPQKLELMQATWFELIQDNQAKSSTREILYAKLLASNDTLHVFVNHWPSRMGGEMKSRPKRLKAASLIKSKVDSIQTVLPNAKIIITGDFNDYPTDISIANVLQADSLINGKSSLFNMSYKTHKTEVGSYNYRGYWGCLDQMIVSKSLVGAKKGYSTNANSYTIVREDFMLNYNKKGKATPKRTYQGQKYIGGFSDHLPVVVTFFNN
jgi:predicted extracellular nuclease